jgi:hypothetical protein
MPLSEIAVDCGFFDQADLSLQRPAVQEPVPGRLPNPAGRIFHKKRGLKAELLLQIPKFQQALVVPRGNAFIIGRNEVARGESGSSQGGSFAL